MVGRAALGLSIGRAIVSALPDHYILIRVTEERYYQSNYQCSIGRTTITPRWDDPIEWLWILAIAGVGAAVSWYLLSPTAIAASILLASGGLLGICYLAFLLGWWLPVAPSLLALLGSAVALPLITNKQLDRLRFRHTLALLLEACRDHPTAGRIAIEYLKQSESQENQAFIEQQLRRSDRVESYSLPHTSC